MPAAHRRNGHFGPKRAPGFVYADKANVPEYLVVTGAGAGTIAGTYRIVTDHLGSLRLVVNADTGDIVQRMDYDEHGNVTRDFVADGWRRVPFGFAGGLYDPDTGLVRFGARDYDPEIARWTAPDPIGFGGGDGNVYAYAGGDPVNLVDPDGRFVLNAAGAFVGGVSGLVGALLTANPDSRVQAAVTGLIVGAAVGAVNPFGALLGVADAPVAAGLSAGLANGAGQVVGNIASGKPLAADTSVAAVAGASLGGAVGGGGAPVGRLLLGAGARAWAAFLGEGVADGILTAGGERTARGISAKTKEKLQSWTIDSGPDFVPLTLPSSLY